MKSNVTITELLLASLMSVNFTVGVLLPSIPNMVIGIIIFILLETINFFTRE